MTERTDYKIYLVDDDPVILDALKNVIIPQELGVIIGEAPNGQVAKEELQELPAEIVIADLLMPELDGLMLTKELVKDGFSGDIILLSQVRDKRMVNKAYEAGVEFYISKPIDEREVVSVIKRVLEKQQLKSIVSKIQQTAIPPDIDNLLKSDTTFDATSDASSKKKANIQERATFSEQDIVRCAEEILSSLGVLHHIGSTDIIEAMKILLNASTEETLQLLQNLKQLYQRIGTNHESNNNDVATSEKAIERRLRRAIEYGASNIAALGLEDYYHPKFEQFSYNYFDFLELRKVMYDYSKAGQKSPKINIKKFLEGLSRDIYNELG